MSFTCTQCGDGTTVRRWEPQAPRWIPFRYPGFDSTARNNPSPATRTAACTHLSQKVSVRFDLYYGGNCSGSGFSSPERAVTFNDRAALPDEAAAILKALTAPTNNGVMVFSQPIEKSDAPKAK